MKRRMTQKNETSFLNYIIPPILIRFTSTVRSCDQGEQKDESNKRAENMSKTPGFSSPKNVENWSGMPLPGTCGRGFTLMGKKNSEFWEP